MKETLLAAFISIGALVIGLFLKLKKTEKALNKKEVEGIKDESKKIVDAKTSKQLVDDFNSRYTKDGNGD